jgi:hypothetical protein
MEGKLKNLLLRVVVAGLTVVAIMSGLTTCNATARSKEAASLQA